MDASKSPLDAPRNSQDKSAPEPESITQAFAAIPDPAKQSANQDLLASLRRDARPAAAPLPEAASPQPAPQAAASAPGEFTRMLQTLRPASSPPQDVAKIFKQVSIERPAEPAPPVAGGNEITPPAFPSQAGPTAPNAAPAAAGSSQAAPGSFTQIFSALSSQPSPQPSAPAAPFAPAVSPAPPVASAPPQKTAAEGPGEFTRLFQSLPSPARSAPQPPPSEWSEVRVDPPADARGDFATAPQSSSPGSFTQMFSAAPPAPVQEPVFSSPASQPGPVVTPLFSQPAAFSDPQPPAQGGFTQLFRALNEQQPANPTAAPIPAAAPAPAAAPPAAAASGGFTQLLQSLSNPAAPSQPVPSSMPAPAPSFAPAVSASPAPLPAAITPPTVPAAAPPPAPQGPGEYTRVISGSALRGISVPPQPAQPVSAPVSIPGAKPAFSLPSMPPPAPAVPHLAPPAFAFPPAAPPQAPAPAPAPVSALQKYLPLILIVNVFLLLVIVLILFFLLRHR